MHSINDVISSNHLGTVTTAAEEVRQLQCNMAASRASSSMSLMEKLELIDPETNKTLIVGVDAKNAHKARTDEEYAYNLFVHAKGKTDGDTYIWSKKKTLLLIRLYKEDKAMFTSGKTKQHSCWEHIAKKMSENGYNLPGKKCCTKFQTLKKTYKQVKDYNNKSGNLRKTWEFLDEMNDLFGTKPWIQPIAVAGSNITDELEESSHQATRGKNKENQSSFTSYKQKILDHKKTRAEQKDKQHKEKMDLSDLKNLIQQVMEKK
ncbi:hypothetical protein DBV15_12187 [Temnothorax longispinosus]|uniref:Myb/SANT-like DNA-binding domain-containing protein n=1 Tax=Temnothorax longispinosus TaxID=300112 RepID=A0A4S2KXJ4_9HYME|nr:hypothetical protein DBV15_12187 [Temnothorax longispinosus]